MKAGKFYIRWRYAKAFGQHMGTTECIISTENTEMGKEIAVCHEKDNFCRATGRKLSLTRAMESVRLTKEERKEIWEAYRNMTPKPRW